MYFLQVANRPIDITQMLFKPVIYLIFAVQYN
jgi:hypothetical protein